MAIDAVVYGYEIMHIIWTLIFILDCAVIKFWSVLNTWYPSVYKILGHTLHMSLTLNSIFIWIQLSFLLSKSYSYGIELDFDTSILTYEYKYHFHLVNQMYGTEVDFDTCILFLMLIRIVRPGSGGWRHNSGVIFSSRK